MKQQLLEVFRKWTPEMEITVKVKFIKRGTLQPLHGSSYTIRLYDKDLFTDDDHLATAQLNTQGEAHLSFYPADVRNNDLGFEELPDLYLLLFKGNTVHFQSNVWDNVDLDKLGLLDMQDGQVLNFGTFLVD